MGGIAALREAILDGVFPPACLGCSKGGVWLCEDCLEAVPVVGSVPSSSEGGQLDSLLAISLYQHPVVGKYLRSLKYQRALCLVEEVGGGLLAKFQAAFPRLLWEAPSLLVSLPMDPERKRVRGVDHALELAKQVQKAFFPDIPLREVLDRTRTTETNARLSGAEARAVNIQGALACKEDVQGQDILLIDDVYTTGATMQEAANVLKAAGASSVHGLVFALT
jgi:ComF family protein